MATLRKYLRSEVGHQGEVFWNQTEFYDDEMARIGITVDRPRTPLLKTFCHDPEKTLTYRRSI